MIEMVQHGYVAHWGQTPHFLAKTQLSKKLFIFQWSGVSQVADFESKVIGRKFKMAESK